MKKNCCFKPDIKSKICNKTAYLCFSHLSMESPSRSKVDYFLCSCLPCLRKLEGEGNRQPPVVVSGEETGVENQEAGSAYADLPCLCISFYIWLMGAADCDCPPVLTSATPGWPSDLNRECERALLGGSQLFSTQTPDKSGCRRQGEQHTMGLWVVCEMLGLAQYGGRHAPAWWAHLGASVAREADGPSNVTDHVMAEPGQHSYSLT